MEKITGTVDKLIFHSVNDGFSILVLSINKTNSALIRGYFPAIHVGEEIEVEGSWVFHKKFGKQFHASTFSIRVPTSILGLKKYLASGLIKGIGPIYAKKLVAHFGLKILEVIEHNPQRLAEISGIGEKRIKLIAEGYEKQKAITHLMVFLQEKNISPVLAAKIYKAYGPRTISILLQDPYRLAEDVWGIGFKTADTIAEKLGFDPLSIKRVEAAIIFSISHHSKQGNLYVELSTLKKKIIELIGLPIDKIEKIRTGLYNLHEQKKIKVLPYQDGHFVTLAPYYYTERSVADFIKRFLEKPSSLHFDLDKIYQELRTPKSYELHLHEHQIRGCIAALTENIAIITGGPGTGKTTLIKKLLSIFDQYGYRYKLAAPTGRAAKRMIEGTGRPALTLHRLLEFDPSSSSFKHNEHNTLKLDILIVDEASMIDIFLGHALFKSIPPHAHVVLLGDVDQLPSVGAGNLLNDLIASERIPCIKLTHIFRQASDSLIIVNAHRINNGKFPISYLEGAKRDYKFIKEENPEMVLEHLRLIFSSILKKNSISAKNTIILSPMNRGGVGTVTLNHYLQKLLNPSDRKDNFSYAGTTFKIGDRVMQIRNNYDKGVFNGDIGTIVESNVGQQHFIVDYEGKLVEYDSSELDEIILSYAVSIHKSQGSEFDAVIIVMFMHHFTLLERNLIYTAITRAKKLCILIGQPKAIAMAIRNKKNTQRLTFLKQFLTSDMPVI